MTSLIHRITLCLAFCLAFLNLNAQKTNLENLGPNINTQYDESAPVISPDGEQLFFWSLDRPDGFGFQDVYVSKRDTGDAWLPAKNIGHPLNDADVNIVLSITPDGNRLLIYNKYIKKDKKGVKKGPVDTVKVAAEIARTSQLSDLALARRVYDSWGAPQQLRIKNYVNKGESSLTAYLSADGKTMVLSMESSDSRGQEDLYVCFFDKINNIWTEPKNLGDYVNTKGSEITPFLAPDGVTLYFSSNTDGGLGGQDIYMTQRLDSTWRNWTTPVNIGPEVNSAGDEYHFKFAADAVHGYLVSTQAPDTSYGLKDIFKVLIPVKAKPRPVVLVRGKVLNQATKTPMEATVSYTTLPNGVEIGSAQSDPKTGEYAIILPAGENYAVIAQGEGFIAISENLDAREVKKYEEIERDLLLVPMKEGGVVTLNNIFFATNKYQLDENSYPELKRLLMLMEKNPNLKIEVAGHTDNVGVEVNNQQLSDSRARAVAKYLNENGVSTDRVYARGYGSKQPKADNKTKEGKALNRRVEFKIISM